MEFTHLYRLETLIAVVVAAALAAVVTTVVVQAPGKSAGLAGCEATLAICQGALAECRQRPADEKAAPVDDLERWKRQTRERGQSRPVGVEDMMRGGGDGPDG